MTKELYEKFSVGDGVTDAELTELIKFFKRLSDDLKLLGPTYHLAWLLVYNNLMACESYQYWRKVR